MPEQGQAEEIRLVGLAASENFLDALGLHPAGHPPALGGAQELVVVPEPAEHHLLLFAAEDHRVEADCSRRRGVPLDAHREVAQHVVVHREIRQHFGQPGLHLRIGAFDAAQSRVIDVSVRGEHRVEVVEAALVNRGVLLSDLGRPDAALASYDAAIAVEATDADRACALEILAQRLVAHFGAPDLTTARAAAEEEIAFAASLSEHPKGMLLALSRQYEGGAIRESFRTLTPAAADKSRRDHPSFSRDLLRRSACPVAMSGGWIGLGRSAFV